MDRLYPKHGLRRMCEGVIGLATPELERDVHAFFAARKIDFGGKTLEQYLEQLRVAVALREREGDALATYLRASAETSAQGAVTVTPSPAAEIRKVPLALVA